jgi:hypothetical protein
VMQIVSQKVSTGMSAMAIKNCKEWTFWPSFTFLLRWFLNV